MACMIYVTPDLAVVLVQLFPTLLIALAVESRGSKSNTISERIAEKFRAFAVLTSLIATFSALFVIQFDRGHGLIDWVTTLALWSLVFSLAVWATDMVLPTNNRMNQDGTP